MKRITDLQEIKSMAIALLHLPLRPTQFPFIVDHPVFQSPYWNDAEVLYNIMESDKGLNLAFTAYEAKINNANTALDIMYMFRSPYYLTFLKFTRKYWNADDFAEAISYAWIEEENPNGDVNVPVSLSAKWFREAPKESLMELEEYETYISLPETFVVYRGVAPGRNPDGMSWTDKLDSAEWFAKRFNEDGYVLRGIANKKDVLAYFNRRNESEVLIPAEAVQGKTVLNMVTNCSADRLDEMPA